MFYCKLAAVFYVIIFSLLMERMLCKVFVYNIETHTAETSFKDVPSSFGETVPPGGLRGMVVASKPEDGCSQIGEPPILKNATGKWFVLIKRYGCLFDEKVRNAQKSGYDVAIVHNVNSNDLEPMAANDSTGIYIPSIFISDEAGLLIKERYLYEDGYYVWINYDVPPSFSPQIILTFAISIAFFFFIMVICIVVKHFSVRRRQRRYRLAKSSLNKLSIHKFIKSDPYEMCAICLEEYVEDDKLRVLPCSHAYHSKCIDPWLTKNRRVCPVCKRKIFGNGEVVITDSDSDSEDETAPLVRNNSTPNNAGTFVRQIVCSRPDQERNLRQSDGSMIFYFQENPFRRATRNEGSRSESSQGTTSGTTSTSGSVTNSMQSLPEGSRQTGAEVRNLIQEPSINSAGATEVPVVRTGWQNFFQET